MLFCFFWILPGKIQKKQNSIGLAIGLYVQAEEHTSELQSRQYLVCRLLLEKKKKKTIRLLLHCYVNDIDAQRSSEPRTELRHGHTSPPNRHSQCPCTVLSSHRATGAHIWS